MKRIFQENNIIREIGKIHFTFKGVRYGGYLFLFLCSCYAKHPPYQTSINAAQKIDSIYAMIKPGDVILRNGTDDISQATRKFNRTDSSYSHCGIIEFDGKEPFVYHAIGGSYNPSQHLKKETLKSFCNPAIFDKIAVYRYKLSDIQNDSLQKIILHFYHIQLPFDVFFNFDTDDKMYCSEFVFKSMNTCLHGQLTSFITNKGQPLYVSIDDLFLNSWAGLVKKIRF